MKRTLLSAIDWPQDRILRKSLTLRLFPALKENNPQKRYGIMKKRKNKSCMRKDKLVS